MIQSFVISELDVKVGKLAYQTRDNIHCNPVDQNDIGICYFDLSYRSLIKACIKQPTLCLRDTWRKGLVNGIIWIKLFEITVKVTVTLMPHSTQCMSYDVIKYRPRGLSVIMFCS